MSEEKELDVAIMKSAVGSAITISAGASISEIAQRARLIDELYRRVMKKDVHYGVIPGTGAAKPSLLKAGAEKLMATFNLGAPDPVIDKIVLPEGHREYMVTLNIKHYPTGRLIGSGVGVCSTMESKYRYRNTADYEVTDEVIPRDAKEKKQEYRKKGYGMKKVDGEWAWVKYGDSEKSENPDLADLYNTCLKMAKKRALVDAVLTVTGASDIFTQDVEDFADLGGKPEPDAPPAAAKPPVRKMEVTEGIQIWDVLVEDVQEKKTPEGAMYYIAAFDKKRDAGTRDQDLAQELANSEGVIKVEVKPGRQPGSHVLLRIVPEEPANSQRAGA